MQSWVWTANSACTLPKTTQRQGVHCKKEFRKNPSSTNQPPLSSRRPCRHSHLRIPHKQRVLPSRGQWSGAISSLLETLTQFPQWGRCSINIWTIFWLLSTVSGQCRVPRNMALSSSICTNVGVNPPPLPEKKHRFHVPPPVYGMRGCWLLFVRISYPPFTSLVVIFLPKLRGKGLLSAVPWLLVWGPSLGCLLGAMRYIVLKIILLFMTPTSSSTCLNHTS
mmetsp:Transcript_879/g.1786  ORF Transcript_879/g.1786 Transcript_879/m.1786 type:complete len:222 (-) Transcript_879:148-813(-)